MAGLFVAAACGALAGQPKEAGAPKLGEGRGQVILTWDEFVKITGYDPAKKGAQVLTIPWKEVEDLLGVKIKEVGKATTVDLPWDEFKALLQWSIQRKAGEVVEPPTEFVITSSEYSGTLADDGAKLTLDLKLEVLREKGWKRIQVLPSTVAVTQAKLPKEVFLNSTGQSYELLTQKAGAMEVLLEFSVAVEKEAGVNRVNFPRVAPAASILDLKIERENVDVKVNGAQLLVAKSAKGETRVTAALPSGVPVSISWERALPKVEAPPPKLYAETRTLVAVAEGVLLCQEAVNFNILHTGVRELKLAVPADTSVLTVTGQNVQDWRVDKAELSVVLRKEVVGSQSVSIAYERPATDSVEAPVVRATGVEREKGYIGVVAVSNVEIASGKVVGATSIDVRQLPADLVAMTKQPVLLAFRYVGEKFSIPLTIKRHAEVGVLATIVDSALFTAMQLNDGRRITKVVYSVRNNRNQFLRLEMPEGAEIWSVEVSGNTVSPAKDKEGNVLLPLIRSASGARELASFPVEMVYVETPAKPAPTRGTLRVGLPTVDAPVMHLMFNYYLPAEGRYTVGWGRSGFKGRLRVVEEFTSLATGRGRGVVQRDAAKQAAQMQQEVQARVDRRAREAGATPIRVRLPINGKLFKLEKILALPQDDLWFEVTYRGWEPAE